MKHRKTLKDLTLKDDFMFGAVMSDENICKQLLEMILQIPIDHVIVSKEKSISYNPDKKGVRLDVYAKDAANSRFNVEMQSVRKAALGKRARYYHSQIDMELLLKGEHYRKLPNTYVIFICDFDPFGDKKYVYSFENRSKECGNLSMGDGSRTIFLSTHGDNPEEVPEALVKFLKYVKADLNEFENDFEDDFVRKLQESVRWIKRSREKEAEFMTLEEKMREQRLEGKAEAIIVLLSEIGSVSEDLKEYLIAETDTDILDNWLKLAARSTSIKQFQTFIQSE